MKRKLAAVLAGVMVLTMGMATVFAAASREASDDGNDAVTALVSETDTVTSLYGTDAAEVAVNEDGDYTIAVDEEDAEAYGLVDGETYYLYIDGEVVEAVYSEADGCFIISADAIDLEEGAVVSVDVYSVDSEEESDDTDETETEEPSETESEDTTGTTDGDDTTTGDDDTTDTSSTGSNTSSPKTGAAAALPVLAVAALAGVVVCGKKVKFYE